MTRGREVLEKLLRNSSIWPRNWQRWDRFSSDFFRLQIDLKLMRRWCLWSYQLYLLLLIIWALIVECFQEVIGGLIVLRQAVVDWCGENFSWYFVAHCHLTDRHGTLESSKYFLKNLSYQDGHPDSVEPPPTGRAPAGSRRPRPSRPQPRPPPLEHLLHWTSQCHCGREGKGREGGFTINLTFFVDFDQSCLL